MKFPTLSRSKQARDVGNRSPKTTALPSSQTTSIADVEKPTNFAPSTTSSIRSNAAKNQQEKNVTQITPIQEAEALDKLSGEPEYPTGAKLAVIVASLCLSVFLMALDNTIIATAIPKITDHFKALDDVGWYGSGNVASSKLGT